MDRQLAEKVVDIVTKAQIYHQNFYRNNNFHGPSLYFHRRALDETKWDTKLEMIYATLASWGMHRMGTRGPTMSPFVVFKESMRELQSDITELTKVNPCLNPDDGYWDNLSNVFNGINIMDSEIILVGHSKVMAHLLPNLVAPIDRSYTLNYLFRGTNINNDRTYQWELMQHILLDFYYPVCCNDVFREHLNGWLENKTRFPWDTSALKVIDNLVIGARNH